MKKGIESVNRGFSSKRAKALMDILLLLGFIVTAICSKMETISENYWQSSHCILSLIWFLLIGIHVAQHWGMICAFTKKKVIRRNKITALTLLVFVLMFLSILSFIDIFPVPFIRFHHVTGHIFVLIILIHTVDKWKRFISFLRNK